MIDNGISSTILFKTIYKKMDLQLRDLFPCTASVQILRPEHCSTWRYLFTTHNRETLTTMTVTAQFSVIDGPDAFNVMLGHPALYDLKEVTFIYHLCVKFPIRNGVGCLRGIQRTACECYNLALTKPKKKKHPTKVQRKVKVLPNRDPPKVGTKTWIPALGDQVQMLGLSKI
uniref:Uncharacterized protein n=1 Tax=Cannabis sativa TaxID=3483 RepID=A0A803PL67_CANSA